MKRVWESQMKYSASIVKLQRASRAANRLSVWSTIVIVALLANIGYVVPAFAQIVGTAQLNIERRGHTATLLDDGKVLIVGGDNQSGMIRQAEIFDAAAQSVTLSAASIVARTDHTATKLSDGRVIVIGGQGQNGSLTSTEIYDPMTASFTSAPSLTTPRSGHTATTLSDGKILIAGGDNTGSAEIYDPATQRFLLVTGSMQMARKFHSAILTSAGQVLIVGGVNAQNAVLNTAEVFDPTSQSFYMPPTDMQAARALATLKLLADGKVQIIGGDAELSMEVFDPSNGIFIAKALLPPNTDLLGATLSTQSRAALFSTSVSQDPLLQGVLTSDQLTLLDRADHSITELPSRNQALVAGGINSAGQILNSAKLVSGSKASVTTDKTDYAPGQIVTITGSGFQPNEQVDIYFHEFPEAYPDVFLSATANQQGNFVTADFAPKEIDLGRIFTLTAIGQSSGFTAQTAFKDARNWTLTFAGSGTGSVTITPSTGTVNAPVSCGGTGTNAASQTVTKTCSPNITTSDNGAIVTFSASASGGSAFGGWSAPSNLSSSTCSGTTNPCSAVLGSSAALTVTFNGSVVTSTTLSSSSNPSTYGQPVAFTATVAPTTGSIAPTGTVQFKIDGTNFGSPVALSPSSSSGVAASGSISTLTVTGSPHTIEAVYIPTGSFTTSTGMLTGGQTIQKATPTATLAVSNSPQTYNGSPQAATVAISASSVPGAVSNIKYNGSATLPINTGTYTITSDFVPTDTTNYNTLTGLSAGNFVINKASAVCTVTGFSGTYDGLAHGATGSCKGVDATTVLAGLNLGSTFTNVPGGTANWTFTDGTGNYNNQNGSVAIVINKADATCTVNGFTGPYDGAAHGATGSCKDIGDVVLAGLNLGATFTNVPGGTAHWTFSGGTNYTDASGDVAIVINKATATINVVGYTGIYDGNAHGASGSATGVGGVDLSASLDLGATFTNVPGGTAHWTFTGGTNYNDASGDVAIIINKADPTCSITPYNVTYDGNGHTAAGSCTGVNGETLSGLDLSSTTHTNAGEYTNDPWTFTDVTGNYNNASGTVHDIIDKANATINVTPYHVTYDGNPHIATGTATGVKGESLGGLDLSGTTHTNAGDYPTDPWTFTDVTGNYNNASGTVHDIIDKANATINVVGYTGVYDSNAHGASGTATGVGGVNLSASLNLGATFTNVPGGTAHWTFTGGTNYNDASGDVAIVINKANATINVTPYHVTYDGNPHTVTGTATGVKGESLGGLDLSGTTHTNAGDYPTDPWAFTDVTGNYNNASGTVHDIMNKANAMINVVGYTGVYDGNAHGASGTATGVGSVNLSASLNLGATFTNVPGGTAHWTFSGGTNYNDASGDIPIVINKAPSTTLVTFEAGPYVYRGTPFTATAVVTGVGGLNQTLVVNYSGNCTMVTSMNGCKATATFAGDTNHMESSDSKSITITTAFAFNGFYSPIGGSVESGNGGSYADPVKSFKLGSTIPVKFGATWLNGGALVTGIHTLQAVKYSNATDSDPPIDATPTDAATDGNQFRLTDTEWHFNLSTKGLTAGTWLLRATLVDGSQHTVWITIKK